MSKRQQCSLDFVRQCLERWKVLYMRPLVVHFPPELFDGIILRRVTGQLENLQALGVQSNEALHGERRVVLCASLNQPHGWRARRPHAGEKGHVGCRGESSLLALIPEPSSEGLNHAKHFVAFALTRCLDPRLVAPSGPGI